jgi:hypothetical protein
MSPLLFLLAMEPLHKLVAKAQDMALLNHLSSRCQTFRIFLYADAAALFIGPSEKDLKVIKRS